jgi:exosortase K
VSTSARSAWRQRAQPLWDRVRAQPWVVAGVVVAVAVVVVGKQLYRDASPADLAWILAPTAKLVSWITGAHFAYESGAGWIDPDVRFVIAPACAGINFALAAFLAVSLGTAPDMTSARTAGQRLAVAAALAVAATIVINTIRISIAVAMHRGTIQISGDPAELHRIEGIIVYLVGLVALYALVTRVQLDRVRWLTIPLAAYLAITLVLPAANGAISRGDFARHAGWILGSCIAIAGMFLAIGALATLVRSKAWRNR